MQMKKIKFIAVIVPMLLAACAHTPQAVQAENNAVAEEATISAHPFSAENEQVYPKLELSSQMLYTFLLADIAAQRGQNDVAAQGYMELAKQTHDLRVVRRAAQLAYDSGRMEYMQKAFSLWNELDPHAMMPKQMLATVLMSGGKLDEAKPYLVELLAADSSNAGRDIVQIYPLLAHYGDKGAVYKMLQQLTQPYLSFAEMHWVLAQAASAAGQQEAALKEVRIARHMRSEWEMPVLLEAQLVYVNDPVAALDMAKIYLSRNADANEVRMFYARSLLEQKKYPESRAQFQLLLNKQPGNADLAFAIALLSIQMGEFDLAEAELKQTLATGKKDSATVHYYLAQLQEAKKDNVAAMQEYKKVNEGEYLFSSRLRMAFLLVKSGKLNEAQDLLRQTPAKNKQQQAQLILTEAQILRDAKKYDQAYKVLSKGLEQQPEQPDLLYEAAMVADKQGNPEVFEKYLRTLIKVEPDHAHAYNALGYSLLERKVRLPEAMQLVEKAYQLAPDDAAIMDSMGWGYYRLGNLPKSLEFMRRAYIAFPDPEVAAHLGEVLWNSKAKEEAKKIWQESLKENPDNAALQAVIKKCLP
jgi:tetratricopeptide (TPR) repeat protein